MGANIGLALNVILALLGKASEISALISAARAENRDITDDELARLTAADDAARAALAEAIEAAKRAGG